LGASDCASIPGPDGKPYPNLAQHALRAARVLAGNIFAALDGRQPQPFIYDTLGMMGSLGHGKGFGQLLKVRVRGWPAWFIRRTYYLLQTPGWAGSCATMIDWTFALLFSAGHRQGRSGQRNGFTSPRSRACDAAAGQQEEGAGQRHCVNSDRWCSSMIRNCPPVPLSKGRDISEEGGEQVIREANIHGHNNSLRESE